MNNHTSSTYEDPNDSLKSKPKTIYLIVGFIFMISAVAIIEVSRCPTGSQRLAIYSFIGAGIGILFPESASKSKSKLSLGQYKFKFSGALTILVALIWGNPISKYEANGCPLFTNISVSVHGPHDRNDIILKGKGGVILELIGKTKLEEPINENGDAFFPNVMVGDSVRVAINFSEPYHPVNPDSVYSITTNDRIDLPIKLTGIDKIRGKTLYNGNPIPLVKIEVDCKNGELNTTTDSLGNFACNIPDSMQQQKYEVIFRKENFETDTITAYPQTGEPIKYVLKRSR